MVGDADRARKRRKADRGKDIVRGVGSLTVQSTLNAVLGFVLLASLVRFLPLASYGTYASVQVTVSVAAVVSGFGLSSAVVRFLAPSSSDEGISGWGVAKAALYLIRQTLRCSLRLSRRICS